MRLFTTLLISLSIAGCQTTQELKGDAGDLANYLRDHTAIKSAEEIAKHKLGSQGNPVRADMPKGEHEYLSSLACSDGSQISYRRLGSAGTGPYGTILDIYNVSCFVNSTLEEYTVYMDMYHPNYKETQAIEGFLFKTK